MDKVAPNPLITAYVLKVSCEYCAQEHDGRISLHLTHRRVLAGEGSSFGKSKALGWRLGGNFPDSAIKDPCLCDITYKHTKKSAPSVRQDGRKLGKYVRHWKIEHPRTNFFMARKPPSLGRQVGSLL